MAMNYRGTLHQFSSQNRERAPKFPEFIDLGSTGTQFNRIFHVKVEFIVDGRLLTTTASARKKKLAYKDAARRMLEKLERLPKPKEDPGPKSCCATGTFMVGMKVRAKWDDTNRFYDGVVAEKKADGTYDVFWPQWRNKTENIKAEDIQSTKIRIYSKGRLRVRDGKAGIDVVCQPKGIVITVKGDQPDMEVNDTLVAINGKNLKGLMPDEQAKIWKAEMSNGQGFLIEREIPKKEKKKNAPLPRTDAQALQEFFMRNRKAVKLPPQYNIVQEIGMPHNRMYTIECVLEFNNGEAKRVKASARSKKKAKQEAAKKMVQELGDKINQRTGGTVRRAPTKRKAAPAATTAQPPTKKIKTDFGKPLHERLQQEAEDAYEKYLKLANAGDQEQATKTYKVYEDTYKQYSEEYRKYAAAENP